MRERTYIKFILTFLFLAVVCFGYLAVSALDRLHRVNVRLLEKLEKPLPRLSGRPSVAEKSGGTHSGLIANQEFFDPQAVSGGRIIQTLEAEPPGLNYIVSNEAMTSVFTSLCTSSLAERNWKNPEVFQPMLAESWTISPDRKQFHIKLRKGVFWQEFTDPVTGEKVAKKEVTADDFAFFFEVITDPDVNCAPLRVYYQDLEKLQVHDPYSFTITWKKAYFGTLASTLGLTPLPRHFYVPAGKTFDGKAFNDDHRRNRMIVGCGPYRFVRWEKDRRLVFERNQDYFGNALGAAPSIQYIVYDVIKHPNTRFQALGGGKVDILSLTPEQWVKRSDAPMFVQGKVKRAKYLLPSYSYIGYNHKNPLFQDRRVRQALTMLIDREKLRKDIYHELAENVNGPFFLNSVYYDRNLKPHPFDPVRAKKLLAEAGWRDTDGDGILDKDGKPFSFTMLQISSSSTQQKMMPVIKESFAAAGIDMRLQNVEWSVYLRRLEDRSYDACCLGWASGFDPDLYQVWHSSQTGPGGSNHISYKNRELDQLIEELRITFDMEKRVSISRQISRILHEDQPYTFLFTSYSLSAYSARYRNVQVFPVGLQTAAFWVPALQQLPVPGM